MADETPTDATVEAPPVSAENAVPLSNAKEPKSARSEPGISRGDLARITDAPNAVESFIATLDWMQANHTITADVRGIVVLGLEANRAKLEKALVANVNN